MNLAPFEELRGQIYTPLDHKHTLPVSRSYSPYREACPLETLSHPVWPERVCTLSE